MATYDADRVFCVADVPDDAVFVGQGTVSCLIRSLDTKEHELQDITSGYATWFTAGGAIRIAHYDVIDDVITRKL